MPLPIDPAHVTPDDYGEHEVVLEMEHEEAIEVVREACEDVGFGIPVEFSPSETLNREIRADRDPYYVLGACHPEMADRALDQAPEIGALFPCNVVIWEEDTMQQRVYHVSIMKIARLVGVAENTDAWRAIVSETSELTEQLFAELEQV